MGIYQTVCYKVEDLFIKMLTKKQKPEDVKLKVENYRKQQSEKRDRKKAIQQAKVEEEKKKLEMQRVEQERIRQEKEVKEKQEIESILEKVVDPTRMNYTFYEYQLVQRNKEFFIELPKRVFDTNEVGLTFLSCEFDKSSKKEILGFLIVTNKRVLFLTEDFTYMDKFRYQTIINITGFNDGILEKGIYMQYGKRRLEFDEIYDKDQMHRVVNLILSLSGKSSLLKV